MIRPTMPEDVAPLTAVAVAVGLFPADDTAPLGALFADYFGGNAVGGHGCLTDVADGPTGVADYAPAPATDRTWYLTLIAVRPDYQGRGRGTALLRRVEQTLGASGQRVLLVETCGSPDYARTRRFFARCGYGEEARIRDYWAAGDDMVLLRKVLNTR